MVPFPMDIEVPKYDKYDANGDPHGHVCHFYILSMDFLHEDRLSIPIIPKKFERTILRMVN